MIPILEIDLVTGQALDEEDEGVGTSVDDNRALALLQKVWDKVF